LIKVLDALDGYLTRIWDWVDKRFVVRRSLLGVTFALTAHSYLWAIRFAETTDKSGAELALVIGAVTAPISLLMAQVAKLYNDGRGT
jgi:hypothetical protein